MSRCTDKRLGNMLYAYELGMLSDADREAFEIHLLECPVCNEKARQMQTTARIIRDDPDLRDHVRGLAEKEPDVVDVRPGAKSRSRRRFWAIIPAAAIILLVLILQPWQIEIRPRQEAIAAENRLAVMYFSNLADADDPERLGKIITNLLIADLAESQYLQVVSSQRLQDILRMMGNEDAKDIDPETATRVARKAGARWMLSGSILQTDPVLVVAAELVDVGTGDAVASQKVTGAAGDDVFALVDTLSAEVKNDLTLPPEARREIDRAVAEVTSSSAIAYRYYLEGVDYYNKFYSREALESFERAIGYDSTLAMAYYYLANLKDRRFVDLAVKYSDRAGRLDRMYIEVLAASIGGQRQKADSLLHRIVASYPDEKYAYYVLGNYARRDHDYEKAVIYFRKAIAIDSLYKNAYGQLAYAYARLDDFDHAIEYAEDYVDMAPDEANPYDTRGDIYAWSGRLEEAIASYKKSLEINPEFFATTYNLAMMTLLNRNYDASEDYARQLMKLSGPVSRSSGRFILSLAQAHRGHLRQALQTLDDGIAADRLELGPGEHSAGISSKRLLRSRIFIEWEEYERAAEECLARIEISPPGYRLLTVTPDFNYVEALAMAGDFAGAEEHLALMEKQIREDSLRMDPYWYAAGAISRHRGQPDKALEEFGRAANPDQDFYPDLLVALAHLEAGNYDAAIERLEKLKISYTNYRAFYGIESVKLHYYLGQALESLGDYDRAAAEYETFLDIWSDADPGIPSLEDARIRLARLRSRS